MTGWRFVWVIALVCLVPGYAHAGIYFTEERPGLPLPTDFREVQFRLMDLRSIAADKVQEDTPLRAAHRKRLAALEALDQQGTLLPTQRIDLGACYLRLLRYRDAKRVLEEAERVLPRDDVHRFLLLTNLAVTFQGLAETEQQATYYDQAISYQRQALECWPDLYPGWWVWQNQSYRRVEHFYLELLRSRRRETARTPGPKGFQTQLVDDLFTGVKFLGPGDVYQAGVMAPAYWNQLPLDAPQVVLQLLFWFPYDDRLYWLFGELLNARGQVVEAFRVLDDLVEKRKLRYRELMQHHRIVEESARMTMVLRDQISKHPALPALLFLAVAPRGVAGDWGAGAAALEAVWPVTAAQYLAQAQPPEEPVDVETKRVRGPVEWQPVLVGFAAGVVVGILALMQMRQWRYRRGDSINERRFQEG